MIIFDTSKFHKLLDNKWLNGPYICPNLILNWFISQGKRTYKLTHYHDNQIYVYKEHIADLPPVDDCDSILVVVRVFQLFSGSDPKRFRPKTLTETPSSFLALDYLGPILGSSNW
jgi:hypothetical protein